MKNQGPGGQPRALMVCNGQMSKTEEMEWTN